jgi:3-oxoacyl-[acyl-carrier protein] reductase
MDLELKGKIAVVTGCSVGIGRGIAKYLAAEGVQTVVIARRGDLLATLQDEIERSGGPRPMAITVDLTDRGSSDLIRDKVIGAYGRADILINNAGGSRRLTMTATDEEWEAAMEIGFTSIRRLTQAFLPAMREQRWGRIINIGGSHEPAGINGMTSSKGALRAWSKGLSNEVGVDGITVNSLLPGRIHSEQIKRMYPTPESEAAFSKNIPLGYFGEPDDVAFLVACLCSPKARYMTGEAMYVDGGLHRSV